MCLNIAGSEEFLLGIHLFDTDLWEEGHTRGITKLTHFVDTKVRGHGWRRRSPTNNGFHSLKSLQFLPDVFGKFVQNNVHNVVFYFFSPPVPKMGSPCGVQALTIDHCGRRMGV